MATFNWVDYVVLGLCFLSMAVGFMRGLVKEVLSLITWFVAFIVASLFATRLAAVFSGTTDTQPAISSANDMISAASAQPLSLVSVAVSYIVIFIGVLIIGKIANYFVSSVVGGQGFSGINRLLGGVFGFIRGVLTVLIAMFLVQLSPMAKEDYWTTSYFVQVSAPTVKKIEDMVAPRIQNIKDTVGRSMGMNNLDNEGLAEVADVLERTA